MTPENKSNTGKNKRTILFADNAPDFLITRAEFLEDIGYRVIKAFSIEEARRFLAEAHVNLAILDIRMIDNDDENDVSGLSLAKDPAYSSIPKIIWTDYPVISTVKEALGPSLEGLPPAVDYVSKADGPQAMADAVEKAFTNFVKINWQLDIQWDVREPLSFPHLVSLLMPKPANDILIYRAGELEDLICKIFYDYQHIRLGRLLWHDTHRFCLPVLTHSAGGATNLRLLVCGERELLKKEQRHIAANKVAPDILGGTELRGHEETTHFGANIYELRNINAETIQTMRDLFQIGRERHLKAAFENLLDTVLKAWHQHGNVVENTSDLMSVYRRWAGLAEENIPGAEVEQRAELLIQSVRTLGTIAFKREADRITFQIGHDTKHAYPDPVTAVFKPLQQYAEPAVCRISPGRLTADNVLVDAEFHTWLTDFAQADQAPQWWDFVCLEAAIRFDLSQAPDLPAWQEFEESLAKANRLDEKLEETEVIPELRTSLALIEQIRHQAAVETGPDPIPYFGGLLAWTVEAIVQYDPGVWSTHAERLRGAHLLLSACMLAERLETVVDAPSPAGPLHLDGDGIVRLGERKVAALSGLHLKLLQCLSEQAGKIVSPATIVEKVYNEKYEDKSRDASIRQEILRLREKIEPDVVHPRYILTVRGKGYCLNVKGDQEK